MKVSFIDLGRLHVGIMEELNASIARVFASSAFILGEETERFEHEFASYIGTRHAIGVSNASDGITMVLEALGIGPGYEIITAGHGAFMTVESIINAGVQPRLVDVDPYLYTIDPARLEEAINTRTRAIMPVHLYGNPVDLTKIASIAARHNIPIIEDAAQAHGARFNTTKIGSVGIAAVFSFYPGKNLGACGDAGAITTSDDALAKKLRMIRDHGREEKYIHGTAGRNARLDGLQAAILRTKLPYLDSWNKHRRGIAEKYCHAFQHTELILPREQLNGFHVYHLFVVRHATREKLRQYLASQGIQTGLHYPIALHRQPAFSTRFPSNPLPIAETCAQEVLSLPCFPGMTDGEINLVIETILQWFDKKK